MGLFDTIGRKLKESSEEVKRVKAEYQHKSDKQVMHDFEYEYRKARQSLKVLNPRLSALKTIAVQRGLIEVDEDGKVTRLR